MQQYSAYRYVKYTSYASVLVLNRRKLFRMLSFSLVMGGGLLIMYVVFPILSWQIFYAPSLSVGNILSPIPKAIMVKQGGVNTVFASSQGSGDLANASSWFPTGNPSSGLKKSYFFSIKKLGIKNAKVVVGSDDLMNSLVHYGGSSLPGEYGNSVVFGHSVLPQFFNPTNYKTIFSTLHTLKIGDSIDIAYDGVSYSYRIFDFKVVDPTEISVLEQTYDNAYLTVITCTPPGTYWKRLVVRAKIEKV